MRQSLDELISVFAIAKTSQGTDRDARTFVEALPEGWCYSALMPNGTRIIAFQTDRASIAARQATTDWLWKALARGSTVSSLLRKHSYELIEPLKVVPAHSGRFNKCAGSIWIAVGDAAMTFDPLSGQGTAKALESAYRAVRTILHGEDYQSECDKLWTTFLRERSEFYGSERRWADQPFWSKRLPKQGNAYEHQ